MHVIKCCASPAYLSRDVMHTVVACLVRSLLDFSLMLLEDLFCFFFHHLIVRRLSSCPTCLLQVLEILLEIVFLDCVLLVTGIATSPFDGVKESKGHAEDHNSCEIE